MKCTWMNIGLILLIMGALPLTFAQNATQPEFAPAPPTAGTKAPQPYDTAGAGQASDEQQSASPGPEAPKPWKLPQPCFFQTHGIDMGGWVEQGITYDGWNPVDRFNGPVVTNDRSGEYQLNQAWLYFVRPTKTDGCGWDIGGRIDLVYGTDWRFGQCNGLETRIDDPNSFYGLVLPQFYLEVAYNDLTVKMGHFATLTSLELVPAPLNFFYSHSYLMAGYYDPLLVTGLQAEYKLNDNWTAIGGFNRGWQMFENPNDTLQLPRRRQVGQRRQEIGPLGDGDRRANHDLRAATTTLTTSSWSTPISSPNGSGRGRRLRVGRESDGSVINPGQDDTWYGFEQIFTYKLNNPKWSAGLRYEWVQDNQGSRVAGMGNVLGTARGGPAPPVLPAPSAI